MSGLFSRIVIIQKFTFEDDPFPCPMFVNFVRPCILALLSPVTMSMCVCVCVRVHVCLHVCVCAYVCDLTDPKTVVITVRVVAAQESFKLTPTTSVLLT